MLEAAAVAAAVLVACQEDQEACEVSGSSVSAWPVQTTESSMELALGECKWPGITWSGCTKTEKCLGGVAWNFTASWCKEESALWQQPGCALLCPSSAGGCSPDSHPSQLLPAQVRPGSWGFHEVGGLIRQCFDILGSTVVETKVSVLRSSLEPSAETAGSNWRLPPRQSFLSGKLLLLWSTAHYPTIQGEESASSSCTKPSRGSHSGWNWKGPYLLHILRD